MRLRCIPSMAGREPFLSVLRQRMIRSREALPGPLCGGAGALPLSWTSRRLASMATRWIFLASCVRLCVRK